MPFARSVSPYCHECSTKVPPSSSGKRSKGGCIRGGIKELRVVVIWIWLLGRSGVRLASGEEGQAALVASVMSTPALHLQALGWLHTSRERDCRAWQRRWWRRRRMGATQRAPRKSRRPLTEKKLGQRGTTTARSPPPDVTTRCG
ncbi:Os06g0547800 [Oryza sativa Japonica Group]|uniref:Os06g0547800 protein n=1 Tax=Oryza sativa subsp. japonica TaxID=39947 RepID=A0A0P0WXP5_ORYSJ|nr:Os06g0547800 [Oryza sativa Japonica Group]